MNSPKTRHLFVIGNAKSMIELEDRSVHLVVTSPPYYNAPFDYKGRYANYSEYLDMMKQVAKETYRVLVDGRIVCINCDDMLIDGEKYPIVSDITRTFLQERFRYRDSIIWKKPAGYIRRTRRSGSIVQSPFPMNYYPDNLTESILIFQKGPFQRKTLDARVQTSSTVDMAEFLDNKWYLNFWEITNVLPFSRIEKDVAAFPEEIPYRLITLYSFYGDTVLDPFAGSGTTMKVARALGRNSVGFEVDPKLLNVVRTKIGQPFMRELRTSLLEDTPRANPDNGYDFKVKVRSTA